MKYVTNKEALYKNYMEFGLINPAKNQRCRYIYPSLFYFNKNKTSINLFISENNVGHTHYRIINL